MNFLKVIRKQGIAFLLATVLFVGFAVAQSADADRKIKSKVIPVYPELAKNLKISATVKVQVTVAPNGAVTQAKAMGGHPLLVGPAVDAAKMWRYEPASGATTHLIEFHFSPANSN